ncbi:MAG: N-acetyltransferase [Lentisphaerae bacterium]|nr:N-acetyltransferase [Lentisphaerota bacterium]MCP4101585.1 N-acetyltransferase [Lentisphaerota bacterium]
MRIRPETKNDFDNIYNFIKATFETAKVKDGHEQDFINNTRYSDKYIPELALIAEKNNEIIGYIMISKTYVEKNDKKFEVLYLAPVSVLLEYRNQGIASKLINESFKLAKKLGFKSVFLAGDPTYYNRFGFVPTINHDIKCSIPVPEELYKNIMVCELVPDALKGISGIVKM